MPGQDGDAQLLVLLGDLLGDVLVLVGQDGVHELDDGDIHAVVSQDVRELHADRARANDDHGLREFVVKDLFLIRNDVAAELDPRERLHDGTRRNDAVIEREGFTGVVTVGHLDGVSVGEGALTVNFGDFVLLHQEVDALHNVGGHLPGALVSSAEVERHVA